MAGLNLALGRFSVAKMAISWNNCHKGCPYYGQGNRISHRVGR